MNQGRITHLLSLPTNIFGSYYADHALFRIFYTAIYFGNFLLIGYWAALHCLQRAYRPLILLVFLVLISAHPLDFLHLPPNAYPLQISIPVAIILISRIAIWHVNKKSNSPLSGLAIASRLLFFLGLMFGEYSFLFGLSLIMSEWVIRWSRRYAVSGGSIASALELSTDRGFWLDCAAIVGFLALYFGFRYAFPSNYQGNQLASDFNALPFIKTLFGHILGGTSVMSFFRDPASALIHFSKVDSKAFLVAGLLFFSTFFVAKNILRDIFPESASNKGFYYYLILSGVLIAFIVTTPIALTGKYQSWCADFRSCIFIDSRISFLGLGLIVIGLVGATSAHRKLRPFSMVATLSFVIAVTSCLTYLNNLTVAREMRAYSSLWITAQKFSCGSHDRLSSDHLASAIDPEGRLMVHPNFPSSHYWHKYLKHWEKRCDRATNGIIDQSSSGSSETLYFKEQANGLAYLVSGWEGPEPWGTWSSSDSATAHLPFDPSRVNAITIEFNVLVSPSHPSQRVGILLNGVQVSSIIVTQSPTRIKLEVPPEAKLGHFSGIKIDFSLPDATQPSVAGFAGNDNRTLALGLRSMVLHF